MGNSHESGLVDIIRVWETCQSPVSGHWKLLDERGKRIASLLGSLR